MQNLFLTNNKKELLPILIRETTIKACREFFDKKNFHEVITPTLNRALPLEPNLYSFKTTWHKTDGTLDLYLSTSPESGLKKMLARGLPNCYAISKCFRNLENNGTKHNPEFLMLEWYRKDANYKQIIKDTKSLILHVYKKVSKNFHQSENFEVVYNSKKINLNQKWPIISLEKLFKKHAGINYKNIMNDNLFSVAEKKGYNTAGASWSEIFDQIFLNEVEPHLPHDPFFLVDFPAKISPLCATNLKKPYLAERFEIYIGQMEIGNGNTENIDAELVKKSFEKETQLRQEKNQNTHPYDEKFITALQKMSEQQTKFAGIGLGVDRLAMLMANVDDIALVEPFVI